MILELNMGVKCGLTALEAEKWVGGMLIQREGGSFEKYPACTSRNVKDGTARFASGI